MKNYEEYINEHIRAVLEQMELLWEMEEQIGSQNPIKKFALQTWFVISGKRKWLKFLEGRCDDLIKKRDSWRSTGYPDLVRLEGEICKVCASEICDHLNHRK